MALDPQRQFALLVGLNTYPSSRNLRGPQNDLHAFHRWLKDEVGLPDANITSWVDKPTKFRDPKCGDFYSWLVDLAEAAQATPGPYPKWDRLYILLAGHGYNAVTGQQSLILPMTTVTTWDTVPAIPLRESLRLRALFREIFVVFDACRDVLDIAPESLWLDRPEMAPESGKVRIFSAFASKTGKKAKEIDFGSGKWGGVLTQAFLTGMKGYAADEKGVIYAHNLRGFLYAAVKDKLGLEVEPDVDDGTDPNEEWELFQTERRLPRLILKPKGNGGGNVELRGRNSRTATIDLSAGPQAVEVPYGYYTLTKPDGSQQKIIAAWEEKVVEI